MLKQGETTDIIFTVYGDDGTTHFNLTDDVHLKALFLDSLGTVRHSAEYPGEILKQESSVFCLNLPHEVTRRFSGVMTMELALFSPSKVMIADDKVEMQWKPYAVSKTLNRE